MIIRDLSVKGKVRKLMEDNVEDSLSLRTGKGILKLLRLKQRWKNDNFVEKKERFFFQWQRDDREDICGA